MIDQKLAVCYDALWVTGRVGPSTASGGTAMRSVPLILVAVLIAVTAVAQEASKPRETPKDVTPRKQPVGQPDVSIDRDLAGVTALEIVETTTDAEAKWRAVRILGALRYECAVPVLVRSLDDKHRYVRSNAARALGDMKVKSAAKPLIELLRKETEGGVIEQTSLALWQIEAKEAIPALKEAVGHKNSQTRSWVLQAIGELGDRKDVPFLAGYLNDPETFVQLQAAKSIQKITGADFGFPLPPGPTDPSSPIQWAKKWWEENKKDFAER